MHKKIKKMKRVYHTKVLGGVLGGISKVYGIDPTILRVGFIAFLFLIGIIDGFRGVILLLILYALAWFIMPSETN